jgi:AcrR family transcriptional regulator
MKARPKAPSPRVVATPTPSRKELTHARILDAAAAMVRRNGYAATGVAEVMKEAGLTHGGFYAHFGSRAELLAEAIEHAGIDSLDRMRKVTERAPPKDALMAFVDAYLSDAHAAAPQGGCTFAALGTETPRQAPEVRAVHARRLREMADFIERQMPGWGGPGQHDKALAVYSCLVGAMVLARAADDKRVSKDIRAAARAFVKASLA